MNRRYLIAFGLCASMTTGLLLGCGGKQKKETVAVEAPAPTSDLSLAEAQSRAARLSNVQYTLKVDLSKDTPEYTGESKITFDLNDNSKDLRIDFFEGKVAKLEVNGQTVDASAKQQFWIALPAKSLKQGQNEVFISYSQVYSNQGRGLHRFKDPEDGQYYLHTQFQTYDANRFMPSFDQPDLRAKLTMQVVAPAQWQVISATRETSKTGSGETRTWDFPPSDTISTYLFSLHAGPYKVFEDRYKKIPLRIFVRPALAKYLNTKEWFKITKQGFTYFEKSFATPYPFKKYDQLVVPEFNSGGMENVGAVTYSEWVVPRSKQTRLERQGVAGLLLHEMAHMWFGDLVTMKWWNDLWLNESFATIMAYMALAEGTEFKYAWQDFAGGTKRGAYIQDALGTTHPIEASVQSAKEANAIFDGITYNKGASVLKQLRFYITPKAFEQGVQHYFKTYSYKNTELKDFIGSLQLYTKKDLNLWADRWLRQSGTDDIAVQWQCEGKKLSEMTVTLTPSKGAQFRPQALELGLYNLKGKSLTTSKRVRVDILEDKPVKLSGSWACPDAVYPNDGDQGYLNVRLDAKTLQTMEKNLGSMKDPLIRALVWNDLWRMVRNQELSLQSYMRVLESSFPKEKDLSIIAQVLSTLDGRRSGSVLLYLPIEARQDFVKSIEAVYATRLKQSKSGSDEEKLWVDAYLDWVQSPEGLDAMVAWYKSGKISKNFPLDIDRKWAIAYTLQRYGHAKAKEIVSELKSQDASDRGVKVAMSVEAVVPDQINKDRWVHDLVAEDSKLNGSEARSIVWSLFPIGQENFRAKYYDVFYSYLKANKGADDNMKVGTVLGGLSPLSCRAEDSQRLKTTLQAETGIAPVFSKNLRQSLEEDERCQAIRKLYSENAQPKG